MTDERSNFVPALLMFCASGFAAVAPKPFQDVGWDSRSRMLTTRLRNLVNYTAEGDTIRIGKPMANDRDSPATKGDLADLRTELKGDLADFRTELKGDLADLRTELKGDLADLRAELKGDLAGLRTELRKDLANQKDELIEAVRDIQTEVLKAFYGFTQTIQERFKQADDAEAALKRRMATLESRVLEVEKRLNMPPNAA